MITRSKARAAAAIHSSPPQEEPDVVCTISYETAVIPVRFAKMDDQKLYDLANLAKWVKTAPMRPALCPATATPISDFTVIVDRSAEAWRAAHGQPVWSQIYHLPETIDLNCVVYDNRIAHAPRFIGLAEFDEAPVAEHGKASQSPTNHVTDGVVVGSMVLGGWLGMKLCCWALGNAAGNSASAIMAVMYAGATGAMVSAFTIGIVLASCLTDHAPRELHYD